MRLSIRIDSITIPLTIFALLFLNILIIAPGSIAQGNQLYIYMTDNKGYTIDEINEGEDFLLSVYILDNDTPGFQIDVEIEFDGETYWITADDENREIALKAPQVSMDTQYTIKASKDGYISVEETINVLNKPKLIVTLEKNTLRVNEPFSVTVTDDKAVPVEGATVYIRSVVGEGTTNKDGLTWLDAPDGHTEITIIAEKEGYQEGTKTARVVASPGLIDWLIQWPWTPVVFAVLALIGAIVFVNVRQNRERKYVDMRSKEISKEQVLKRYGSHGAVVSRSNGENVQAEPKRGAKVEEIRISKPRKDKDVVPVKTEEDEVRKVISRKAVQKRDYDWFEGTDNIRYEIDRITGEIDEDGKDKWFEGVDDIRAKIDEKVKKKDKKKDK